MAYEQFLSVAGLYEGPIRALVDQYEVAATDHDAGVRARAQVALDYDVILLGTANRQHSSWPGHNSLLVGVTFPQLQPFNNAAEAKCELGLRTDRGRGLERPHPENSTYRPKIIPPRSKSILTVTCPLGAPYSKRGSCRRQEHDHGRIAAALLRVALVHATERTSDAHR